MSVHIGLDTHTGSLAETGMIRQDIRCHLMKTSMEQYLAGWLVVYTSHLVMSQMRRVHSLISPLRRPHKGALKASQVSELYQKMFEIGVARKFLNV